MVLFFYLFIYLRLIKGLSALCTIGVVRRLRRTSIWSHRTRKSTSRSWRRTTTASERTWGPCWRGRFLSSINPSSGPGWRTGKQTCQVKQPWQEALKLGKKDIPSLCEIAEPKGKWEQMEKSRDPFTPSVSPLKLLIAEPEAQYTDWVTQSLFTVTHPSCHHHFLSFVSVFFPSFLILSSLLAGIPSSA